MVSQGITFCMGSILDSAIEIAETKNRKKWKEVLKSKTKSFQEYIDFLGSADSDDQLLLPGDCRDVDEFEEILEDEGFKGTEAPDDPPLSFQIEISDEPMPESYWLTINDR